MNLSNESDESNLYSEHLAFRIPKISIYVCILVLSTAGNIIVVTIIAKSKRMKATPGNLLIINLAVCDLLTPILSIPFDLALEESDFIWPFGVAMCKLLFPAATFTCTSSSLTLAAISLDRYRTLMHPFKRRLNTKFVIMLILVLHIMSVALTSPYTVMLQLTPSSQCMEVWPSELYPKIYTIALLLGQYVLPLLFMISMYIQASRNLFTTSQRARSLSISSAMSVEKPDDVHGVSLPSSAREVSISMERRFRKNSEHNAHVTKMFVIIVIVFAVCSLPNEVLWIWADFFQGKLHQDFQMVAIVCRLFTYSNSCINPFIFYKFSRDFHKGFLALFGFSSLDAQSDDTTKRAHGGVESVASDRLLGRLSPSFLTPRGSLQSTPRHSVSFADQLKEKRGSHDANLSVNNANCGHKSNMYSVDAPKAPWHNGCVEPAMPSNQCNIAIRVNVYECDLTIELNNLESLSSLRQTDC